MNGWLWTTRCNLVFVEKEAANILFRRSFLYPHSTRPSLKQNSQRTIRSLWYETKIIKTEYLY